MVSKGEVIFKSTMHQQLNQAFINFAWCTAPNPSYNFRNDCVLIRNIIDGDNIRFDDVFSVDSGQHPRLLRLLLSGKVSIQSVIIFDKILSFVNRWDKEIKETIIWPEKSFKIAKLKPFVNVNITKCKFVMKEIFV